MVTGAKQSSFGLNTALDPARGESSLSLACTLRVAPPRDKQSVRLLVRDEDSGVVWKCLPPLRVLYYFLRQVWNICIFPEHVVPTDYKVPPRSLSPHSIVVIRPPDTVAALVFAGVYFYWTCTLPHCGSSQSKV